MKQRLTFLLLITLVASLMVSCSDSGSGGEEAFTELVPESPDFMAGVPDGTPYYELKQKLNKYAVVDLDIDESVLSEPEKEALEEIIKAGHVMDKIFFEQVWAGNKDFYARIDTAHKKIHFHRLRGGRLSPYNVKHDYLEDLVRFYDINFGPWDRLDEDAPFLGDTPKPLTANYYPEDMTKEEFEAHIKSNPADEDAFRGFFTTIRRQDGKLVAVPYNVEYKEHLEEAAAYLSTAADILTDPANKSQFAAWVDYTTLAKFLQSRADAFLSNEYVQSDMDWMDVKDNIIDVTIGPYEVYEDGLNGYKAAYTAFIGIKHPSDSKKLAGMKRYLQKLENSLPIPNEHKNPNRGSESPISVIDLAYTGGDTKAGVQTVAYNLPNDETVRELKGSKKVMLKNITRAKFSKILIPIATTLLDTNQIQFVDFDAYFNNVLMHEMAHGLGPGTIKRADGTETTVSRELKELYTPLEEAKADITGLYCNPILMREGFFPAGSAKRAYISFLPGFFRAIRFGATSAHGRANMIEFNWMTEKGAITLDPKTDRFHVNLDKMPEAVKSLTHELLMLQALGDYDKAEAFLEKYGNTTDDVERLLKKLESIPVDIEPQYTAAHFLKGKSKKGSGSQNTHDHTH